VYECAEFNFPLDIQLVISQTIDCSGIDYQKQVTKTPYTP